MKVNDRSDQRAPRALSSGDPLSDARKPRNRAQQFGQVFTGPSLASRIANTLGVTTADLPARLLDPCVGPSTFLKALKSAGASHLQVDAFDIDRNLAKQTTEWCQLNWPSARVFTRDYLLVRLDNTYDFAILNPPYVRQEWINKKHEYRTLFRERYTFDVPGTANLYVYFIAKVLVDLKPGGRLGCVIYDSWQSTRFGQWLASLLKSHCSDLDVEPVAGVAFDGRLIDATVIYATKRTASDASHPQILRQERGSRNQLPGTTEIGSLFETERGLRLKQADFFLTHLDRCEQEGAVPFVKKVCLLPGHAVPPDHREAVLLLGPKHGNARTRKELSRRLQRALKAPDENVSILTWHRERPKLWATHTRAPKAPLLFNYFLRGRPRHIYNPSRIYSDNFYGLTPTGRGSALAWLAAMSSTASSIGILLRARNQGSGLAKLQLFEYRAANVIDISSWSDSQLAQMSNLGEALIAQEQAATLIINQIDKTIAAVLQAPCLQPARIKPQLAAVDLIVRKPKH